MKYRRQRFWLRGVPLLLLAAGLGACGFHLKGQQPLPAELARVYVDNRVPYEVVDSVLERSLRDRLVRRGAQLAAGQADASRLTILKLSEGRRVQSVGGDGKAVEYLLVTSVDFEFAVGAEVRIPRQTLTVQRDYSFDETQLLAKEAERERRQREMQEELAGLIMLRLDSVLGAAP